MKKPEYPGKFAGQTVGTVRTKVRTGARRPYEAEDGELRFAPIFTIAESPEWTWTGKDWVSTPPAQVTPNRGEVEARLAAARANGIRFR